MSASIFWQPVKGKRLSTNSSDLVRSLSLPHMFDEKDLAFLRGFAAGGNHQEAAQEIIEAVESHGKVRVWAEY